MATPPTPTTTAEVLSSHAVEAVFAGEMERRCMFLTSLCPDRCSHANKWAMFDVTAYLAYAKPGHYGDEKQSRFALQLRPEEGRVAHAPGTHALVRTLAVGDAVRLSWVHEYASETHPGGAGTSKYPVRRVTAIERA